MHIVTIDSDRRISLPEDVGLQAGQRLEWRTVGDHWELIPLVQGQQTISPEKFEELLEKTGEAYADSFRRLAKE